MGYTTQYQTIPGLVANSTGLASNQFYVIKMESTATYAKLIATSVWMNSTTETVVGLLQNAPAAGEAVEFAVSGIAKGMVGQSTAIAIGARLNANSTSLLVDAATTDNKNVVGVALEASSASGDIIAVLLLNGGMRY
jgi:hypothetical protein